MLQAAMHENHLAMASEHNVLRAGQLGAVQLVAVPHRLHPPTRDHLGLRVRLADAPHAIGERHLRCLMLSHREARSMAH